MKLVRCEKGHFYDEERFSECPHCNTSAKPKQQNKSENQAEGKNIASSTPAKRLNDIVNSAKETEDLQKTIGYFGDISFEPVVGWLVGIEGKHFGEDFKLKTGRNFIGRSPKMDVQLKKDSSVSRERHAVILYDPKGNIYLAQPGDSKELFYLNDNVVLNAEVLKPSDVLTIGNTKLLFIPCCSDKFKWDDVKDNKKD